MRSAGRRIPVRMGQPAPKRGETADKREVFGMSWKAAHLAFLGAIAFGFSSPVQAADEAQVARGKYLVGIAGCHDCHTPGYFFGKPDMSKFLAGSDVGFEIPGLGVFVGRNITPDEETGIGKWMEGQIISA